MEFGFFEKRDLLGRLSFDLRHVYLFLLEHFGAHVVGVEHVRGQFYRDECERARNSVSNLFISHLRPLTVNVGAAGHTEEPTPKDARFVAEILEILAAQKAEHF